MAIYQRNRKSGIRYQVKVKGSDGRWITATFSRRTDARAYEAKLTTQKHSGRIVVNLNRQITIGEYFDLWRAEASSSNVSEGWRQTQIQMFRDYISPVIGSLRLAAIVPSHVLRVINRAGELGRGRQLQLHLYNLLHKMFRDAVELFELLATNPVKASMRPKLPMKESAFLSIGEIRQLMTYARGREYEIPIWLGIMAGLRVGEIQALRWEEVNLETGMLRVRSTYARKEKIFRDYPKGKRWRSVQVPPELLVLLRRQKEDSSSPFVVCSNDGSFLSYHTFHKVLKRYCREAGVPPISTHGLRHSASEIYMEFGASRDDLRILFGHSSSKVTDRYVHDRGLRLHRVAKEIRIGESEVSPNTSEFPQKEMGAQIIRLDERRFK